MQLTREQAIEEHRKMWNWIADETERTGKKVRKWEYLSKNGLEGKIFNDCFCCEYTKFLECNHCPINWGSLGEVDLMCIDKYSNLDDAGLFSMWRDTCDALLAAKLARQIANLPERTDNIPVSEN